jgi:phenylacetate-coenzyme A ligase PaaK-like adenylate-forming protein
MIDEWKHKIFEVRKDGFQELALEIFRFQYQNNRLYRVYADMLGKKSSEVKTVNQIPFLPINFFKSHSVKTTEFEPEVVFESSGTTQTTQSHHLIKEIEIYRQSFIKCFELFYGSPENWCIIGLLPSYLERKALLPEGMHSSLVFMMDELISRSNHPQSGFYLNEFEKLNETLKISELKKEKTLLIGVTFALLDFAEQFSFPGNQKLLKYVTVMETGGMKGRRKEMVRNELHELLQKKLGVNVIHSEYGMTELLSQAYSKGNGIFHCPPWMKILIRDEEDPLTLLTPEITSGTTQTGIINVIDLANIYSCSFIATDDAGRLYEDGSFEVLGRIDNSDIRGCSLLV